MNGSLINGFGNSSYDVNIKSLIGNYGRYYATYTTTPGNEFVLDMTTNAKEPEVTTNEDGSKTYRFFLNDNLVWNDGTPITAKDYVFDVLFAASPEFLEAGGGNPTGSLFAGYADYHDGKSISFPGVKYIDDTTFELTLAAENVPYFYETASVAAAPAPMHRYTPNMDIGEDGSSLVAKAGYELTDADKDMFKERLDNQKKTLEEALKSSLETIEQDKIDYPDDYPDETYEADKAAAQKDYDDGVAEVDAKIAELDGGVLDAREIIFLSSAYEVAQVYRFKPDVTCGPYNFVSNENQAITLTLNDKFVGDYEGRIPKIKNIVQKTINQDLDVDMIISDDIDIAAGVIEGDKIEKAKAATDKAKTTSYSRNGYGHIAFHTDLGTTKYKEVRQAIAYLMDRNVFVQNVLGGYGIVANAEYGLSQWMYQDKGDELEEKINHYTLNIEKANEILDQSPYKFEADGVTPWDAAKAQEAYDADSDGFKYWRYNDKKEQLTVNHYGTVDNTVTDTVAAEIPNNGKLAGLFYNVTIGDFATLLDNYYKPKVDNPVYTAFNLATGFSDVYDPYYQYHSTQIGNDNNNRVNVPEIDELTVKMRRLDSTQVDEFLELWLEFQVWWNDYLPQIPLYSNQYFDVYSTRINELTTTPTWGWDRDIVNMEITQ